MGNVCWLRGRSFDFGRKNMTPPLFLALFEKQDFETIISNGKKITAIASTTTKKALQRINSILEYSNREPKAMMSLFPLHFLRNAILSQNDDDIIQLDAREIVALHGANVGAMLGESILSGFSTGGRYGSEYLEICDYFDSLMKNLKDENQNEIIRDLIQIFDKQGVRVISHLTSNDNDNEYLRKDLSYDIAGDFGDYFGGDFWKVTPEWLFYNPYHLASNLIELKIDKNLIGFIIQNLFQSGIYNTSSSTTITARIGQEDVTLGPEKQKEYTINEITSGVNEYNNFWNYQTVLKFVKEGTISDADLISMLKSEIDIQYYVTNHSDNWFSLIPLEIAIEISLKNKIDFKLILNTYPKEEFLRNIHFSQDSPLYIDQIIHKLLRDNKMGDITVILEVFPEQEFRIYKIPNIYDDNISNAIKETRLLLQFDKIDKVDSDNPYIEAICEQIIRINPPSLYTEFPVHILKKILSSQVEQGGINNNLFTKYFRLKNNDISCLSDLNLDLETLSPDLKYPYLLNIELIKTQGKNAWQIFAEDLDRRKISILTESLRSFNSISGMEDIIVKFLIGQNINLINEDDLINYNKSELLKLYSLCIDEIQHFNKNSDLLFSKLIPLIKPDLQKLLSEIVLAQKNLVETLNSLIINMETISSKDISFIQTLKLPLKVESLEILTKSAIGSYEKLTFAQELFSKGGRLPNTDLDLLLFSKKLYVTPNISIINLIENQIDKNPQIVKHIATLAINDSKYQDLFDIYWLTNKLTDVLTSAEYKELIKYYTKKHKCKNCLKRIFKFAYKFEELFMTNWIEWFHTYNTEIKSILFYQAIHFGYSIDRDVLSKKLPKINKEKLALQVSSGDINDRLVNDFPRYLCFIFEKVTSNYILNNSSDYLLNTINIEKSLFDLILKSSNPLTEIFPNILSTENVIGNIYILTEIIISRLKNQDRSEFISLLQALSNTDLDSKSPLRLIIFMLISLQELNRTELENEEWIIVWSKIFENLVISNEDFTSFSYYFQYITDPIIWELMDEYFSEFASSLASIEFLNFAQSHNRPINDLIRFVYNPSVINQEYLFSRIKNNPNEFLDFLDDIEIYSIQIQLFINEFYSIGNHCFPKTWDKSEKAISDIKLINELYKTKVSINSNDISIIKNYPSTESLILIIQEFGENEEKNNELLQVIFAWIHRKKALILHLIDANYFLFKKLKIENIGIIIVKELLSNLDEGTSKMIMRLTLLEDSKTSAFIAGISLLGVKPSPDRNATLLSIFSPFLALGYRERLFTNMMVPFTEFLDNEEYKNQMRQMNTIIHERGGFNMGHFIKEIHLFNGFITGPLPSSYILEKTYQQYKRLTKLFNLPVMMKHVHEIEAKTDRKKENKSVSQQSVSQENKWERPIKNKIPSVKKNKFSIHDLIYIVTLVSLTIFFFSLGWNVIPYIFGIYGLLKWIDKKMRSI